MSKGSDEATGGAGNINQIRDILIGPFQRDQEARFDRAERALERLGEEAAAATARTQEKLQKSLDAAVDALEAKIADLSKRFSDATDAQKRETEALAAELSGRVKELETRIANDLRELEKLTDERMRSLRGDTDAALAVLRDEKTSRHDLGDYLTEIGLRLKGETSLQALESSLQDLVDGDADS